VKYVGQSSNFPCAAVPPDMIAPEPVTPTCRTASDAERLLRSLHHVVRELMIVDDGAADLPLRQYRVCVLLFERPWSMTEISREMGMSSSAMSQIADRLEQAGFVTRHVEDGDRRVRRLRLTERGETLMRSREAIRLDRTHRVLSHLTTAQRQQALDALDLLVRSGVRATEAPPDS